MHRLPFDPPSRRPTWRGAAAGLALVAAVPPTLWAFENPLAAAALLALAVGLVAGARRVAWLARCLRDCDGLRVDLPGRVRVTIARPPADGANCR